MGAGGKVSEERIAETLIKKVVEEELEDIPLQDVPFLSPDGEEVKNEQKKAVGKKVFAVVRKIADKVKDDPEIQDDIKGIAQNFQQGGAEEAYKTLNEMFKEIFQDGITWEKIVISLYVVWEVMTKCIMTALHQSVMAIKNWTVDFFKKYVLGWIIEQGGMIRCTVQS